MILRDYGESDGPATLDVFRRAIRVTAARDYTPEQVAAWASDEIDPAGWDARRRASRTRVAEVDGSVAGSPTSTSAATSTCSSSTPRSPGAGWRRRCWGGR